MSGDAGGAVATYEAGHPPDWRSLSEAERRIRATAILEILRGLQDRASLPEILVIARCLERIEYIRRLSPGPALGLAVLDEALLLELSDLRPERDRAAAQHEADRDRAVGPAMCLARVHGGRYCTADAHLPSCAMGTADEGRRVCPVGGEG